MLFGGEYLVQIREDRVGIDEEYQAGIKLGDAGDKRGILADGPDGQCD